MPEAIEDVVSDDAQQEVDVVEEIGEVDAAQKAEVDATEAVEGDDAVRVPFAEDSCVPGANGENGNGSILQMVAEKYLLRSESEWKGREEATQLA